MAPHSRVITDEIDAETVKVFLVFQGKILSEKKVPKDKLFLDISQFKDIALPPIENFIPLKEVDSRLIVASYFDKPLKLTDSPN